MSTRWRAEWPTWVALCACYGSFLVLTFYAEALPIGIAYPALAIVIAFHSSLQHEAIHGHPTSFAWLNTALVIPPIGLSFPYYRYRETHLSHHRDARLTDPYDDPESWYIDPENWRRLGPLMRGTLILNNTVAGRLLIGPGISIIRFVASDMQLILKGRTDIAGAWVLHACAAVPVVAWLSFVSISPLGFGLACYCGLSLINLRSFLEHRADERVRGRSAIVEDRGPLALLYLNNNLHAVHHAHPETPWAELPVLYREHRDRFLRLNGGYVMPSYWSVLRRYGVRAKEPPAHPLMTDKAGQFAE